MIETSPDETVQEFRLRAREWLAVTIPKRDDSPVGPGGEGLQARARVLQRMVWDGGFAGICWPVEHGGLGLPPEYQRAFTEEALGYEMPFVLDVPTFGILAATLIDFGTHDQKARHLPAILRGEEQWVQFLSEPTGGSDLAGCLTRAERDGDTFVVNGSKTWSSGAVESDYAMCLVRTNRDVPKHRGLTMLIMKVHQDGVQIRPIRQVNGARHFCEEFFDQVVVPVDNVLGEVDDGWTVATKLLLHERTAVAGGSVYTSGRPIGGEGGGPDGSLIELAEELDLLGDPRVRQVVADQHVESLVNTHIAVRVSTGIQKGLMPPSAGSILKLFHATHLEHNADAALEVAGSDLAVFPAGDTTTRQKLGQEFLNRQSLSLGGGSNEIQRNIISERVLGMPREWAADREVAYRDVKHNTMPSGPRSEPSTERP